MKINMKMDEKAKTIITFVFMLIIGMMATTGGVALLMTPILNGVKIVGGILGSAGFGLMICSFFYLSIGLKDARVVDARKEI